MEKKTKIEKITMGVCIGVLFIFACTIAVRVFTRQVLIKHYHIDNAFTRFVWFDNGYISTGDDFEVEMNWEELFPFDASDSNLEALDTISTEKKNGLSGMKNQLACVKNFMISAEEKIETYTSSFLVFYSRIVEVAYSYEKSIGWNFAPFEEYNGVIELSDGYLSNYEEKKDTSQQFAALSEFNDYCQKKAIDFLYVQAPCKISEYDDTDISGMLDFSNQNANDLLAKLEDANIEYYDIRETIHENNIHNHDLFYKTDHHWLTTTGLWASQNILKYCNDTYGWNADVSLLDANQFDFITYKECFLGSQGKKVTLSRCRPDDFTLLYPKYDTKFHYYVPAEGINAIDDYSVVYNMSMIENSDYYNNSPYSGCNYGDQPLIQIENQKKVDDHKILLIRDSFGNCVVSCFALAEKNVDSLDLRHFTGSVKTYIEESNPDLVIVMSNAISAGDDVDYSTHTDKFDFR